VATLLNEALSGGSDKNTKLRQLAEIQELVIHRKPELLDSFFDEILQFRTDTSTEVRKHVVGFIEAACKMQPALFSRATDTLSFLMADKAVPVIMSSIRANINLYRPTFQRLARAPHTIKHAADLWNAVDAMRDRITELLGAKQANVQNIAMTYLECVVVVHSMPTADSVTKGQDVGLNAVPLGHPFLDLDQLKRSGREAFDTLKDELLSPEASGAGVGVIIGLLADISWQRPQYMRETVDVLIGLQAEPPEHIKSDRSWTSTERKLKAQLVHLFKHQSSAEFHDQLIPVLESMEVPISVINEFDKRGAGGIGSKRGVGGDASEPNGKRARFADPQKKVAHKMYERLKGLPLDRMIDLIMRSMAKLPDQLPAHLAELPEIICDPPSDDEEGAAAPSDPRNAQAAAAALAAAAAAAAPATAGARVAGKKAASRYVVPAAAVPLAPRKPFTLKALKLDAAGAKSLSLRAFKSVLRAEKRESTWENWATVVAKLVSELQDEALTDELISWVLEAPKERDDIALLWLYHEHMRSTAAIAADAEVKVACTARWEECVAKVLTGLKPHVVEATQQDRKNRLFPTLVLGLPILTVETMELVKSYCEDKQSSDSGFRALYDILKSRPPAREICLPILFAYTSHSKAFVRANAVRVAQQLFETASLRALVEDHSTQLIAQLESAKDSVGVSWTAETINGCLDLRLAMSAKYPAFLRKITEVYANVQGVQATALKTFLRKRIAPTLKEGGQNQITQDNQAVLGLIGNFVPGCEDLIILLLHTLTSQGLPRQGLISAVEKSYLTGKKDARLLVPVLQGLSKPRVLSILPAIFALGENDIQKSIDLLLGNGAISSSSIFDAAELLVVIHRIPKPKPGDALTLEHLIKVWSICFGKKIFNQDVLTIVLQRLEDDAPLPVLFFRTALRALTQFPRLKDKYFANLLRRLATKDAVWNAGNRQVIQGFIKLCEKMLPQSLDIVARLSAGQQREVYTGAPSLKLLIVKQLKLMKPAELERQSKDIREALGDDFPKPSLV
jgi:symplekin